MSGVPSPADLESWGATWKAASDEYLIGLAARQYGVDTAAALPAMIESQRRLRTEISEFNSAATSQVTELIRLSKDAGRQAQTMIYLTWAIAALTVVLGIIAGVQLWAMLKGGG